METPDPVQYCLQVALKEDTTFESFHPLPSHHLVVNILKDFACGLGDPMIALWGPRGAGVSHLLQAVCNTAVNQGFRCQYLPLSALHRFPPEDVLESLEELDLVCIDDLEIIVNLVDWEHRLFHLYNRLKDAGKRLLLAAANNPAVLTWQLPDLKSRVLGAPVFYLQPLDDDALVAALKSRAQQRGLRITDETAHYLLHRVDRNAHSVFELLDRLDNASLRHQRKLTVPFVKKVLGLG